MKILRKAMILSVSGILSSMAMDQGKKPNLEDLDQDEIALANSDLNLRLNSDDWNRILGEPRADDKALDLRQKVLQALKIRANRARVNPEDAQLIIKTAQEDEKKAREHIGQATDAWAQSEAITQDINESIAAILLDIKGFTAIAKNSQETVRRIQEQLVDLNRLYAQAKDIGRDKMATLEKMNAMIAMLGRDTDEQANTIQEINVLLGLLKEPQPEKIELVPQHIIVKSDDEIDQDYEDYILQLFNGNPYPLSIEDLDRKINPMDWLSQFPLNTDKNNVKLPTGDYSISSSGFWAYHLSNDIKQLNSRGQGWKIHISAMPYSAEEIAKLILPKIEGVPSQKGKTVSYKIIGSIPLMRTLYSLKYASGKETQPGKFLVIYPENTEHAYELAKVIDQVILDAKQSGQLSDNDFLPLLGDAEVGESHQVYVRYGRHTGGLVKMVDNMNISMTQESGQFSNTVEDDRFTPWPDFMNKKNSQWKDIPNPFKDLPLSWVWNNRKITWETRPDSWLDLSTSMNESSMIESDIKKDQDLEG